MLSGCSIKNRAYSSFTKTRESYDFVFCWVMVQYSTSLSWLKQSKTPGWSYTSISLFSCTISVYAKHLWFLGFDTARSIMSRRRSC